ncbi:uncharacterized protein LOC114736055 [Neltuma alba]|uniref:uncharacterized protein LOC114736055 n=1 Tax=Neltuma alba TaxID=207710 RepID=UPI0010A511B3|nr:uncharacterized protein LOC114736055 [Prosopis alba]
MSAKAAIEVSKRIHLKSPCKPDSVLNLFRGYGFSDSQISKIVKLSPVVLSANPEKTILPKLKYFQSLGFSCSELPGLLMSHSVILDWSLKNRLIPFCEALKSVLNDDEKVRIALRRSRWFLIYWEVNNLAPNMKVLTDLGVPRSSICALLTALPNVAFMNPAKFVECVKFANEAGIDPSKVVFIQAIIVLAQVKKSSWESKLDLFERFGWSRNVTLSAFSKFPHCMLLSEENLTSKMKFLVDEMGCSLEDIAGCPTILSYSLKRIIPRWSVIKILKINGLAADDKWSLPYIIIVSEKNFREKFVIRFQEIVPQLPKIYKDELRALSQVQKEKKQQL